MPPPPPSAHAHIPNRPQNYGRAREAPSDGRRIRDVETEFASVALIPDQLACVAPIGIARGRVELRELAGLAGLAGVGGFGFAVCRSVCWMGRGRVRGGE
jgi:hypothetical protein